MYDINQGTPYRVGLGRNHPAFQHGPVVQTLKDDVAGQSNNIANIDQSLIRVDAEQTGETSLTFKVVKGKMGASLDRSSETGDTVLRIKGHSNDGRYNSEIDVPMPNLAEAQPDKVSSFFSPAGNLTEIAIMDWDPEENSFGNMRIGASGDKGNISWYFSDNTISPGR